MFGDNVTSLFLRQLSFLLPLHPTTLTRYLTQKLMPYVTCSQQTHCQIRRVIPEKVYTL